MIRLATRFATGLATRFPIPSPKRDATRGPITEVNSLHTPLHIYFVNRAPIYVVLPVHLSPQIVGGNGDGMFDVVQIVARYCLSKNRVDIPLVCLILLM